MGELVRADHRVKQSIECLQTGKAANGLAPISTLIPALNLKEVDAAFGSSSQ